MLLKSPRCPAKVISSPSGPCTVLTPGVRVSRSSNLRPRIGVVSTGVWLSVLADAVRGVSTTEVGGGAGGGVGVRVAGFHGDARQHRAGGVGHGALDHAGCDLGLGCGRDRQRDAD